MNFVLLVIVTMKRVTPVWDIKKGNNLNYRENVDLKFYSCK